MRLIGWKLVLVLTILGISSIAVDKLVARDGYPNTRPVASEASSTGPIHKAKSPTTPRSVAVTANKSGAVERYGQLPLSFEPNQGQSDPAVKFLSRNAGPHRAIDRTGGNFIVRKNESSKKKRVENGFIYRALPRFRRKKQRRVVSIAMLGSNPHPVIAPLEQQRGKSNYFVGKDPQKWRNGIPNFAQVKYSRIYPGIDLLYYGNHKQLEFDFTVTPGTDPNLIRLGIKTESDVKIGKNGDLVIGASGDAVQLHRPDIYQIENGKKHRIQGGYVLNPKTKLVFR